jgi:predicted HTH domain antitoxin
VQVTFDIPDDLASQFLAAGKEPSRAALESLAVEGYRTERLSEGQVKKMLGYSTRMEVHALLAEHAVCLHYTSEDLEVDAETSRFLRSLQTSELAQHST